MKPLHMVFLSVLQNDVHIDMSVAFTHTKKIQQGCNSICDQLQNLSYGLERTFWTIRMNDAI